MMIIDPYKTTNSSQEFIVVTWSVVGTTGETVKHELKGDNIKVTGCLITHICVQANCATNVLAGGGEESEPPHA